MESVALENTVVGRYELCCYVWVVGEREIHVLIWVAQTYYMGSTNTQTNFALLG